MLKEQIILVKRILPEYRTNCVSRKHQVNHKRDPRTNK